jgi:dienelactone hydrolase
MVFLAFGLFPGRWSRRGLMAGLVLAGLAQLPAWLSQAQSQYGLRINSQSWLARWRDAEAMGRFEQWSYSQIRTVVKSVDQWARPGEEVLAFWPGFVAASHAAFVPGLENQFGLRVGKELSPPQIARYRLARPDAISEKLKLGNFRIVVYDQGAKEFLSRLSSAQQIQLSKQLPETYRSIFQDQQVSVLVRGQAPMGNPFSVLSSLGQASFPWTETVSLQEQDIPGLYGDRLTVYGYLMQPRRLLKPLPVVILLHGGFRADSSGWLLPGGGLALSLVQAGYVVLALDQRGSMAHGQAFADLRDLGTSEVDDVLSALRFLTTLPGVDPKRVALMGASRGAALALRAAEETDGFRLVVGYSSVVDYRLFYCSHGCAQSAEGRSWCENLWRSQGEEPAAARPPTEFCGNLDGIARCRPWERGCRIFEDGSPLLHVNQLHTPVLLHHSEEDTAAAYQDVLVLNRRLQEFGVAHRLFMYPKSFYGPVGHSFLYSTSPYYNEAAAEVAWDRTMRALDFYLKDKGFWPW